MSDATPEGTAALIALCRDMSASLRSIDETLRGMASLPKTPGAAPRASTGTGGGGTVFPNYGRSKGQPVKGATMGDLEYYAAGARRSIGDPSKSKWHDRERALLAAIEAEIAAQQGAPAASGLDFGPASDDIPF